MTPITPSASERGQAIILFAVALIGMLAFAALAFDGGNLYVEHRRAQSAADNAALAAAYELMQGATNAAQLEQAVLENTGRNGYVNDGADNWVSFHTPPVTGPYTGNPQYVQVMITRTVPTALAQLVYSGPWRFNVQAVARGQRGTYQIPYQSRAVMGTATDECAGVWFTGAGDLTVTGGGVYTNSLCNGANQSSSGGVANGGGQVTVNGGGIGSAGSFYVGGSSSMSPVAQGNQPILPAPDYVSAPSNSECGPTQTSPANGFSGTLQPGFYPSGIKVSSNKTIYLTKGLYCLGADLDLQGTLSTDLNNNGTQEEASEGAMFYFYGTGAVVLDSNAQARPILWAIKDQTGSLAIWRGMLLLALPPACGSLTMNGGADASLTGTIYAPCSEVVVQGNSGTFALKSQLVGATVKITGTGAVNIIYDPLEIWNNPIQPAVVLVE